MLYDLQSVFNRFLKTTGSCDFRDIRQKAAAQQIVKASDCGRHMAELLDFSSNNSELEVEGGLLTPCLHTELCSLLCYVTGSVSNVALGLGTT